MSDIADRAMEISKEDYDDLRAQLTEAEAREERVNLAARANLKTLKRALANNARLREGLERIQEEARQLALRIGAVTRDDGPEVFVDAKYRAKTIQRIARQCLEKGRG